MLVGSVSLLTLGIGEGASARDIEAELDALRALVEQQQDLIERQSTVIFAQEARLAALESQFGPTRQAVPVSLTDPAWSVEPAPRSVTVDPISGLVAQTTTQPTGPQPPAPQTVPSATGEQPEAVEDVVIPGAAGIRGVLTPPGTLVVEPQIEFEQTSTDVFFFNGVEVVETVLVGDVEITDSDRDTITSRLSMRTGITNRSEIEVSVPFVYRDDQISSEVVTAGGGSSESELSARNIGDVEVTGRYQINSGDEFWPIFVANLRFKTDTGRGPFNIARDEDGVETELTTGSGFFALQPSLSFIYPVDPAVFFGSASYTYNIPRDVDETIGTSTIGRVDPGDVFGFSVGVGYALNDRVSLSMSYEHSFISAGTTETNGIDVEGESFDIGALNLGGSLRITDYMRLNVGVRTGITEDAPDVAVIARLPITFDLF